MQKSSLFTGALGVLALVQVAAAAGVSGAWKVEGTANGMPIKITCTLKEAKTGTLSGSCYAPDLQETLPIAGTHRGKSVSWSYPINYQGQDLKIGYDGTVKSASDIEGDITVNGSPAGQFTAKK
ncbi:MAG: hypothetical protein ACRELG_02550 [Gemmataceae bacterium]